MNKTVIDFVIIIWNYSAARDAVKVRIENNNSNPYQLFMYYVFLLSVKECVVQRISAHSRIITDVFKESNCEQIVPSYYNAAIVRKGVSTPTAFDSSAP